MPYARIITKKQQQTFWNMMTFYLSNIYILDFTIQRGGQDLPIWLASCSSPPIQPYPSRPWILQVTNFMNVRSTPTCTFACQKIRHSVHIYTTKLQILVDCHYLFKIYVFFKKKKNTSYLKLSIYHSIFKFKKRMKEKNEKRKWKKI